MHLRLTRTAATAAALVLTLGAPPPASAAAGRPTAAGPGPSRAVTLVTGDRVLVGDGASPGSIQPGPGRDTMSFRTTYEDGHLYVVPHDAARLVAAGRVDRRLFDVTTLVAFGYDDAHTDTVPLIVTRAPGASFAGLTGAAVRPLKAVPASAVRVVKSQAVAAWRSLTGGRHLAAGVTKIWLDGKRTPTLDRSVKQIGAPAAWQAGYTGAGVKVAVLDTGIDSTHPDLVGRVIAEKDFTGSPKNIDDVGHGTHVAATIASTGAKAGGKYKGVAPGALLLSGKVCVLSGCPDSAILDGMAWAAEQGARIVNMSLGGPDSPDTDPMEAAVDALSAKYGTLFVVAAGNDGPKARTLGSPGTADAALTVGAVDRNDALAEFSSRGPRLADNGIKPDITAPGVGIVAARSSTGVLGTPVEDGYVAMSGTSMATPHVAGAAALLAQQHPTWTGPQLKAALTASAKPNPSLTIFEQGSGRVDVAKAITQTVASEPTSLSLGVQQWPHADDQPVGRTVRYRNSGTAPVTLTVSVRANGPDGKPAVAGMFTVTPATMTVPAGGEATATVTANTRLGAVDGVYSGAVTAVAGPVTVRTSLSVTREVESYDVTVTHLDRDGTPAADYVSAIVSLGQEEREWRLYDEKSNTVTVRVPKGPYFVDGNVYTADATGDLHATLLTQPLLIVARKTSLVLDARLGKPVRIAAPDPEATPLLAHVSFSRRWGVDRQYNSGEVSFRTILPDVRSAHLGPAVPADQLTALISAMWSNPAPSMEPADKPTVYGLAWSQSGRAYAGFDGAIDRRKLARVTLQPGPAPKDRFAVVGLEAWGTYDTEGWGSLTRMKLPSTATLYLGGTNTRWSTRLEQYKTGSDDPQAEVWQVPEPKTYRAGGRYIERVGFGVFGPVVPRDPRGWLLRKGNEIGAAVPLFGDAAGNAGWSKVRSGRARLWRDGKLLGDLATDRGLFTVPATAGSYRLAVEAQRTTADVSTAVSAEWTFQSAGAADERIVRLPVSVVRFAPALDGDNAAPAGRPYRIPVSVQKDGPIGTVRLQGVEYSTDDGKTWHRATLAGGNAIVTHPAGGGFVSLRAKATDGKGNTVSETIIRAYKLVQR